MGIISEEWIKTPKNAQKKGGGGFKVKKTNFFNLRETPRFHKKSVLNGARADQFSGAVEKSVV